MQGKELGPLEIEINKLTKEIEECNSELLMLQKYWLNLQKELVKLTQEREEQLASLDLLKKRLTIMQQKKVRTESKSFPNSYLKRSSVDGQKRSKGLQTGSACPSPKNALGAVRVSNNASEASTALGAASQAPPAGLRLLFPIMIDCRLN